MICPNCGTEWTDEEVLCPACGHSATDETDVSTETPEEEIVAQAQEAPADEESLDDLLADMKETFHLEETPASSDEDPTPTEETAEEQAEEETATYTAPEAAVSKKTRKKAGKAVRVLVPIFAVVLLLAAAAGLLFLANETYEKAGDCLAVKDYEQAQALYARFPFFKDSGAQSEQLLSQQQAYDQATALLQQNAYKEASKGYAALGDYRDSQTLYTAEVPYLQALYLMENAAAGNADALSQHPAYDETSTDSVEISLYEGAIQLFAGLNAYKDSATLSSSCYLHLASAYMGAERFDDALACQAFMSVTDAEASLAEYMTYCADDAILADLDKAVRMRYQQATTETDLALINAELDLLRHYTEEDLMFYNAELETLLLNYIAGLETEASAVGEDGFFEDVVTWYTGLASCFSTIEQLIETYDFLGDDAALQAGFVGQSAYYTAAAAIEEALTTQLLGVTGESSEDSGDYLVFQNSTGYKFSLSVSNEYFDEDGESVFFHRTEPVPVAVDASVRIPLLFPDHDDWASWHTGWEYTVEF